MPPFKLASYIYDESHHLQALLDTGKHGQSDAIKTERM